MSRKIHCGVTYTQNIGGSYRRSNGRLIRRRSRRGARTQLALATAHRPKGAPEQFLTVCRRKTDYWGVSWPRDFMDLGDIKCGSCYGILWREQQRETLKSLKEME